MRKGRRELDRFAGTVVKSRVSRGSKSDRMAVQLDIGGERKLILRRRGGHPFKDEVLESLVGKEIECSGFRRGSHLLLEDWSAELEAEPAGDSEPAGDPEPVEEKSLSEEPS